MNKSVQIVMAAVFCFFMSSGSYAKETQIIAGAGPSTKIVEMFFEQFGKTPQGKPYSFQVPPNSIKHAGGIRSSNVSIFGRTGRPLNEKEKKLNKAEIILARIPVVIVVGKDSGVTDLNLKQLKNIINGKVKNWKDVGGNDHPVLVVGREPTEALFTILKNAYPFFKSAKFERTFKKDNSIVNFMKSSYGNYAIAFGAKPNFEDVKEVNIISINNFQVGVSLGLVYDQSNKDHPLVKAVKSYAGSEAWGKIITEAGYMAPENKR